MTASGPDSPVLFELTSVGVEVGSATLLHNVDLHVHRGRCTAIIGPSGAGKSTLLRLLNRLSEPTTGTICIDGEDLRSFDVLALRRRVGLLMQAPVLLTEVVSTELRVGAPTLTDEQISQLLQRVGLDPSFADRLTAGLSGGEAQRVCTARALAVDPQVLLADEPTSALDAASARLVEDTLQRLVDDGLTVVLVSHNLQQAKRLATDVIVVMAGTVADAGEASRVFSDSQSEDVRRYLEGAA